MNIIDKLNQKNKNFYGARPVTIAYLGDSVTHGCFECYYTRDGRIETVYESRESYAAKTEEILHRFYPGAQINTINSGISGDSAPGGLSRFDRDIVPFSPDLVVIAFALNDCGGGMDRLSVYTDALEALFRRVADIGAECIFLTPNMMNTEVSPHLDDERLIHLAEAFVHHPLDAYVEAGIETARRCGVPVCDVYAKWKRLSESGVNTTELLSNKLNHPTREMHRMTAYTLVETMFEA